MAVAHRHHSCGLPESPWAIAGSQNLFEFFGNLLQTRPRIHPEPIVDILIKVDSRSYEKMDTILIVYLHKNHLFYEIKLWSTFCKC